MKISYQDGTIYILAENKKYEFKEIYQIYLAFELLERYRKESENEEDFQAYTVMLDSLNSAKEQFLEYKEAQCIKNLLSIL